MSVTEAPLNFLNVEDADDWIAMLCEGRSKHIQNWCRSTLRKHLLSRRNSKPVIRASDLTTPSVLLVMSSRTQSGVNLMLSRVHVARDSQLPAWATKYLNSKPEQPLLYFVCPAESVKNKLAHVLDYMQSELPDKPFRQTVDVLKAGVRAWDRRLAKQKLFGELSEGTEILEVKALADSNYRLVRLLTKQAYANEGAVMKHCVATYFGRKGVEIYSLRSLEVLGLASPKDNGYNAPSATIEILSGSVLRQIRASCNQDPTAEVSELLRAVAVELEWKKPVIERKPHPDDEDDEDEEDDDDDDDDDDDEDDEEDDGNDGEW